MPTLLVLFHISHNPHIFTSTSAVSCRFRDSCLFVPFYSGLLFISLRRVFLFHFSYDFLMIPKLIFVSSSNVYHCKSIFSTPFYVYTAKKFPGMEGLSSNTS